METLKGEKPEKYYLQIDLKNELVRIVDIINFEGPLLTLFEHSHSKKLYLLDWVDRDNTHNRWLVYDCSPNTLDKFISGTISHYELLMSSSTCFTVDINSKLEWENTLVVIQTELPEVYIPKKDVFFEEVDCPNFEKLQKFIKEKLADFHKKESKFKTFKVSKKANVIKNNSPIINGFKLELTEREISNNQLFYSSFDDTFIKNNQISKNQYHVSANS